MTNGLMTKELNDYFNRSHKHSDREIWDKIGRLRRRAHVHRHRGNMPMYEACMAKVERLKSLVEEKVCFT